MKPKPSINLVSSNFVFIGGLTRSGKSFLCPIISSFKKAEMFLVDSNIENISYLNALNKISFECAKYLVQLNLNERAYNLFLSRNVNFRKSDYSSVLNSKNFKEYKYRLAYNDGDQIVKKIKKINPIFPIMFHDVMINPKLLLESFPKAKIIYIDRDPTDLVNEWMKKKYYGDFFSNPRNVTLSYKIGKKTLPYWCFNKFKAFIKIRNNLEKVVFFINNLSSIQKKNYRKFKKKYKKRLIIVKFDDLATNSNKTLKIISNNIGTKFTKKTNFFIKKEKGNRKLNYEIKKKNRQKILRSLSPRFQEIFYNLEKEYKNFK